MGNDFVYNKPNSMIYRNERYKEDRDREIRDRETQRDERKTQREERDTATDTEERERLKKI